ncbi:TatD DNase family protein [Caldicoprobacter guelmensis]|uniref:TatD family hydrolase n=1 Tax=Caldicoprobacter guelmensis TaxID=1170224 RepID=UPI00195822EA|nr:TatD family hydrolase [Caldicoprobacter guelmensis]MBM7583396.1 TatD DNase family protein [Caldicoprobacter guelmensis]
MLFDTHAHLEDEMFDEDRDQLIRELPEKGVAYVVNVGSTLEASRMSVELATQYPFIYAAVGIHPHEVAQMNREALDAIEAMAKRDKVVAVGEVGLDYYYDFSPRELQKEWFDWQIDLAYNMRLPIIIHDRDAHADVLDILKAKKDKILGGVMHCYSGSWEMAKYFMDLGLYISLGGPVTFKNAKRPVEIAQKVPLDRLVIETDSPYLAPTPYRGRRNNPAYVRLVAEKIAEIRGMALEEIANITLDNAKKLFKIK